MNQTVGIVDHSQEHIERTLALRAVHPPSKRFVLRSNLRRWSPAAMPKYNLGNALKEQGDLDAAVASYSSPASKQSWQCSLDAVIQMLPLPPIKLLFNSNPTTQRSGFGNVLQEQGDRTTVVLTQPGNALQDRVIWMLCRCQSRLALREPKVLTGAVHNNLGNALHDQTTRPYNTANTQEAVA